MSSLYTPKSEDTLAKEGLFAPGVYHAECTETSDKPSKSGNAMIRLTLRVFDADGNSRSIFDYIVPSSNFGERKLRHAANACGLMDKYDSGELVATDFLNTICQVEVKQQEGDEKYPAPKNVIADYIGRDEEAVAKAQKVKAKAAEMPDDSIPF